MYRIPRVWAALELVTAGNMNTYISEILTYLQGGAGTITVDSEINSNSSRVFHQGNTALLPQATNYTLQAANSIVLGGSITIKATAPITISRGGSDTLWTTAAGQTSFVMATGDSVTWRSDGISVWYLT